MKFLRKIGKTIVRLLGMLPDFHPPSVEVPLLFAFGQRDRQYAYVTLFDCFGEIYISAKYQQIKLNRTSCIPISPSEQINQYEFPNLQNTCPNQPLPRRRISKFPPLLPLPIPSHCLFTFTSCDQHKLTAKEFSHHRSRKYF